MAQTLWTWTLEAYGRPDVEPACLLLQNHHGQCVSYLLWAVWAGQRGRLTPATALKAAKVARDVETSALRPLRAERQRLKAASGAGDPGHERLREQIKTEELTKERALLETLESFTGPTDGLPIEVGAALDLAASVWGREPASNSALERLARAFPKP